MTTHAGFSQGLSLAIVLGYVTSLAGCGSAVAPQELHTARDAYKKAETSAAPQLAPVQLDEAKQSLTKAEESFKNGEKDEDVKDLSYVAEKKAEVALSAANREQARRDGEKAKSDKDSVQQALLNSTSDKLSETRAALQTEQQRLAEEKRRLDEASKMGQQEVDRVKAQLEDEKKARADAEKRAASAMASLAEIAKVKEEARGVVITLSGSVLFATGKQDLLPIAQDKLRDVAKALKDQGFKKIVVEGHTDSRGSATQNEDLSRGRAESVRTYLVSQGIPSDKIEAVGFGSRRAVSENETAEGRANNRRVEIVVTPP
jgi:outer membrane protein OmpA-like peptidoglycan-associated protein